MTVIVGVTLTGFFSVVLGVDVMAVRYVRVVTGQLMVSIFVMLRGRFVMLRGMFMMFSGFAVMFRGLV